MIRIQTNCRGSHHSVRPPSSVHGEKAHNDPCMNGDEEPCACVQSEQHGRSPLWFSSVTVAAPKVATCVPDDGGLALASSPRSAERNSTRTASRAETVSWVIPPCRHPRLDRGARSPDPSIRHAGIPLGRLTNPYILAHRYILDATLQYQREMGIDDPIDFIFEIYQEHKTTEPSRRQRRRIASSRPPGRPRPPRQPPTAPRRPGARRRLPRLAGLGTGAGPELARQPRLAAPRRRR